MEQMALSDPRGPTVVPRVTAGGGGEEGEIAQLCESPRSLHKAGDTERKTQLLA